MCIKSFKQFRREFAFEIEALRMTHEECLMLFHAMKGAKRK